MIKIDQLSKNYTSSMGVVTKCLKGVNLIIEKGEICALCGASGSGKTTLLNIISCLDKADSGTVKINSQDITSKKNLEAFRLNNIGIVFQSFNLIEILTVSENIKIPAELSEHTLKEKYFKEIVQELGLNKLLDKFPSELSGGQQQRVAIARALINQPMILLADEPTGNLDSENGKIVMDLLVKIARKYKMTLLIVTHDEKIAERCDRVIHVKDGQLYE